MTRTHTHQRGFSLIVVAMSLAVLAVVGTFAVDALEFDIETVGQERMTMKARFAAETAVNEIMGDIDVLSYLPTFQDDDMATAFDSADALQQSVEGGAYHEEDVDYDVNIKLVRAAPVRESSLNLVRALVYEVSSESSVQYGRAGANVRMQGYKLFSHKPGTVLPTRHAR